MTRLAVLGLAAICPLAAGCANDGQMSLRRALGWDEQKIHELPRGLDLPAHVENVERVEMLGRRIIAQNTFTGIEPMFIVPGIPETVLFHRGSEQLFISEGLVKQCKTEAELAAVLCSELGQMVAEKKAVRRVGADRDSFPNNGLPAGSSIAGGAFDDPGRAAEMAYRDRNRTRTTPTVEPADASKLSRDLLKGAGFDPAELDRVEPLLKQSDRGAALKKQLGGSAPPPKWDN
jgi:hypothetical protein